MMRSALLATVAVGVLIGMPARSWAQPSDQSVEIVPGVPLSGTITEEDPVDLEDYPFDVWRFDGLRGERVSILMWSDDLDPFLVLTVERDGDEVESVASDDDGGGDGLDAFVDYVLQEDGTYWVVAKALPGGRGEYGLLLDVEDPAMPPSRPALVVRPVEVSPIRTGETVIGTLAAGDPTAFDDSFFDRYSYEGTAGELVIVELRSSDFDAYLTVEAEGPGEPTTLETNDDGGDGTDSLLAFRLPSTGTYFIRAGSLSAGETGRYELIVRRAN